MSILEQSRALYADLERSVKKTCQELQYRPKTHKSNLLQKHRINRELENITDKSEKLIHLYKDSNHDFQNEIEQLQQPTLEESMELFASEIKDIKQHYSSGGDFMGKNRIPERVEQDFVSLSPFERQLKERNTGREESIALFSAQERWGRFVDLHQVYQDYINLPQVDRENTSYIQFLETFHLFHSNLKDSQKDQAYHTYLISLHDHLSDFYQRTHPLHDLSFILKQTEQQFDSKWNDTKQNDTKQNNTKQKPTNETSESRSKRGGRRRGKRKRTSHQIREILLLETKITRLIELLQDQINATKLQLQKNQTRTWEEIQSDMQREEALEDEIVEEEEFKKMKEREGQSKYSNPLKLAVGEDGKPMPVWLYKIRGLNVPFTCEICGDYTYYGPKVFDRHFQEWRHAHGMRCLRIPNTKHFHGVTKIQDALDLWAKMQQDHKKEEWDPTMEQMEDEEGNVYDKKTYEDLRRQGLL